MLFQQRAEELVTLLEKTRRDLVGGTVSIGCVESSVSRVLPQVLTGFAQQHPMVQYDLFSANGDDIKEKLDRGEIDLGILLEPVEAAKYDYLRLPIYETWGIVARQEDPIAQQNTVTLEDVLHLPLILPRRTIVLDEITSWFGDAGNNLHVFATHNLLTNSLLLVEAGLGYPICVEGAYTIHPTAGLCFRPITPRRTAGHVLAWKKNRIFPSAISLFIDYIGDVFQ